MSEKRIAASSGKRSSGCRVTSVAYAGLLASARKLPARFRVALYSGRYRPAWRISQTGVYSVGSRASARKKQSLARRIGGSGLEELAGNVVPFRCGDWGNREAVAAT